MLFSEKPLLLASCGFGELISSNSPSLSLRFSHGRGLSYFSLVLITCLDKGILREDRLILVYSPKEDSTHHRQANMAEGKEGMVTGTGSGARCLI